MFNCKTNLYEMHSYLKEIDARDAETYVSWKKELVKILKEFDKMYVKHVKTTFVEMNKIHMQAMEPLNLLIKSNFEFTKLEGMHSDKSYTETLPEFRHFALETEFCKNFTFLCEILREYGTLENHFNIG